MSPPFLTKQGNETQAETPHTGGRGAKGSGRHPPVIDLRALLQAGQQADNEGLEARQQQLLQREEVLLV